jgi:hypothetical protein
LLEEMSNVQLNIIVPLRKVDGAKQGLPFMTLEVLPTAPHSAPQLPTAPHSAPQRPTAPFMTLDVPDVPGDDL